MIKVPNLDELKKIGEGWVDTVSTKSSEMINKVTGAGAPRPSFEDLPETIAKKMEEINSHLNALLEAQKTINKTAAILRKEMQEFYQDAIQMCAKKPKPDAKKPVEKKKQGAGK